MGEENRGRRGDLKVFAVEKSRFIEKRGLKKFQDLILKIKKLKELIPMKRSSSFLLIISIATMAQVFFSKCNNAPKTENSNGESQGSAKISHDIGFLNQAAQINLEEVKLGELAQQNGEMPEIKNLGKMLEEDHKNNWNELNQLAMNLKVNLKSTLDSNAQADYKNLSGLTPREFDVKYCDMMVAGHKQAIALFEKETTQAADSSVQHYATETLPVLHKHLDSATVCQQKLMTKS